MVDIHLTGRQRQVKPGRGSAMSSDDSQSEDTPAESDASNEEPEKLKSAYMPAVLLVGGVVLVLLVIVGVMWILRANETPYTAEQMVDAQIECDAQRLGASMRGVEYDELGCLRDELPKLSDDELNRLDLLIEEQGGTPMN